MKDNPSSTLPGASPLSWSRVRWILFAALWFLSVGWGMTYIGQYENTPGKASHNPPQIRPEELMGVAGKPMLVAFTHPRCSCSGATLEQISRIQAQAKDLSIRIFFVVPAGESEGWSHTALRDQAQRIPGAVVSDDPGGVIAARYDARTSGQVLLFDESGHLAFAGGLTESRGHYGDSAGSDAVAAVLRKLHPQRRNTPVFGCDLVKSSS